ncbi:hypothetical protein HHI36_015376 [Cryptolaemus montrouzieri]|uniref:Uncharacterized protein n=1 Tax=Cryptolaemus montrouzieri TaxID=559131 RepID=A0ABD2N5R3_9CUCU
MGSRNNYTQIPNNSKLKNCKIRLDILHTCKMKNAVFGEAYKLVKKEYDQLLIEERQLKYQRRIVNSDNKSKWLWSTVNEIRGTQNKSNMKVSGDPKTLAQKFNDPFASGASKLQSSLKNEVFIQNIPQNEDSLTFQIVTADEVLKLSSTLKNKFSS